MYVVLFILCIICIILTVEYVCRRKQKSLLEVVHPDWFEDVTKFPEYAFPCKKNCTEYHSSVKSGLRTMKSKKVVIAGLCINIESKIDKLVDRVKHLGSFFGDYKFIVFENDSSDNTRVLLKENGAILIPCEEDANCKLKARKAVSSGTFSRDRMFKMTDYRNRLLKFINNNYSEYDTVCFMDLDLDGPIDIRGVAHSFSLYDTWDSISAHGLNGISITFGLPVYYDVIAYKNYLSSGYISPNFYSIGDFPYKVQSGFCGMAFYKMNIIKKVDYTPKDDNYICEHITFHKNMINNGFDNIYINPNMLLLSGTQGDTNMYPFY